MNAIDQLRKVITFNLATTAGTMPYSRMTEAITKLANAIIDTDTDENIWHLGEYDYFTLDSLIIGAYWHYTEWHKGQFSPEYAALSALGEIYTPKYATIECEPCAKEVYDLLEILAKED